MKQTVNFILILFCMGCTPGSKIDKQTVKVDSVLKQPITLADSDAKPVVNGIEFGFCNANGDQILMLNVDSVWNPADYIYSASLSTKLIDVKFLKRRSQSRTFNGRETSFNFDNCGGNLYQVLSGKADRENSLVLLTKSFVSSRKLLELTSIEKDELSPAVKAKVESEKKRKIKNVRGLVQLDGNRSIYLFEFYNQKDSALATVAYITPEKIIYNDMAAHFDSISTWREGDGGEFGMNAFTVLAVFENEGKIEMVTDWAGEEGYDVEYWVEDGQKFRLVKGGYRYCAPE
jgi:hypothetical protein